ncbi:LysR substrate-binding domain-containing protein [Sulfitobacter sp. SK011]|uniref:LysR substrate-binding domain-containing protein n=1 Tax=Sulfitobacter sp. SK011 TaxID=1389004 RepID=UPI000E0B2FD8|nr:LysR substrate-binding domain-containing protein [Sulfitobacter sp. SK011]AXI40808.1 hypothetical protein C1J02_01685 [Sulfitobacter sp. SK011]
MRISHLNALRALEATLRHGSFSAAAGELGITPAAVGQRVRSLEDYLGKELFERASTGIRALEEVRQIEPMLTNSFSGLAATLDQLRAGLSGSRLSVTLPASFVENWLSPVISEFYQRHAEVDLRLDASNRDVDLLTEPFDFAVRYGSHPTDQLQGEVLFGDHVLPVCSPEFARLYGIEPGLRSFKGIPLIHILNRTNDPSWVGFEGWGTVFGFEQENILDGVRFSKVSSGLQSAIAGQGLVLCGLVEAFNAVRSGQLLIPFGPSMRCETDYKYRLLWVRGRPMTRLQADFKAWLLEKVAVFNKEMNALLMDVHS